MTSESSIKARWKISREYLEQRRKAFHWLRMLAANYLDGAGNGMTDWNVEDSDTRGGKYRDILKTAFEEGRHPLIQVNVQTAAKSMMLLKPQLRWEGVEPEVSEVRAAYYTYLWEEHNLKDTYSDVMLDLLVSGEGSTEIALREGQIYADYVDSLDVVRDMAFRQVDRSRYVFHEKRLPLGMAAEMYPEIKRFYNGNIEDQSERIVPVVCYWDDETKAILHRNQVLQVKPNPYGEKPVHAAVLMRELSTMNPLGMVEQQIGTYYLMQRLMASFANAATRNVPAGVAIGAFQEEDLDRLADGEEGVILRALDGNATFVVPQVPEPSQSSIELYNLLRSQNSAESGVNDFAKGMTDTKVDFATQISYIAQQSGIISKHAAQVFEAKITRDARQIMKLAARFSPEARLTIGGVPQEFGPMMPLAPLMGDDGTVQLAPLEYKGPLQKLQEVQALGQVLQQAAAMPPGTGPLYIEMALNAFEVEDPDSWLQAVEQAQQAQAQAQMQEAQMMAQPAQTS